MTEVKKISLLEYGKRTPLVNLIEGYDIQFAEKKRKINGGNIICG